MKRGTGLCDRGMIQVIVEEKGTFSLAKGESVLSMLQAEDLVHFSHCGGRGTCGRCVIRFLAAAPLPLPGDRRRFSPEELRQGYRLACLARPKADCTIRCEYGREEMKILTGTAGQEEEIGGNAVRDEMKKVSRETSEEISREIPEKEDDKRKQMVFNERTDEETISTAEPCYAAIDLGTTTIAMQLIGMETGRVLDTYAALNPQRRFGADVISRMQASVEGNRETLRLLVRQILEEGMQKWISAGYDIKLAILAGNTVMAHLFMGWNVEKLAVAPFLPAHTGTQKTDISGITTVIIPGISAFVGGDITAGILVCRKDMEKNGYDAALLVDLGTNGEIALMRGDDIYVTATAAGPAFEGGLETGAYGADVIRMTAEMLDDGIVDDTGLMREPYFEDGARRDGILVTQKNIRDLQMAKAAVYAGTRVLLLAAGVSPQELDKVYLAGGFGYFLDVGAACRIGVLSENWEKKTEAIGNAALRGADLYGKSFFSDGQLTEETHWPDQTLWRQAEEIAACGRAINLAQTESFEPLYLSSMELRRMGG